MGESWKPLGPIPLPLIKIMANNAHQRVVIPRHPLERLAQDRIRSPIAIHISRHKRAHAPLIRAADQLYKAFI